MMNWLRLRINLWVILGALLVAGGLIGLTMLFLYFYPLPKPVMPDQATLMTVIPAPSMTPTQYVLTPVATETPASVVLNGIGVGMYVQITGTGGDGLRLRSGPSTKDDPRFLGYDAEVFMVKDGPKFSDDLTWWFLEAPYDKGRSGWAAAQFLSVVSEAPTSTP